MAIGRRRTGGRVRKYLGHRLLISWSTPSQRRGRPAVGFCWEALSYRRSRRGSRRLCVGFGARTKAATRATKARDPLMGENPRMAAHHRTAGVATAAIKEAIQEDSERGVEVSQGLG